MLVAFSGGVDSTLLAVLAKEVLGNNTACVLLDSPVVPRAAVEQAHQIAPELGLDLDIISSPPDGTGRISGKIRPTVAICVKRSLQSISNNGQKNGVLPALLTG